MSDRNRYVIGFILAVALIVIVIVLIVHGLMSGPASSSTTSSSAPDLTSYVGTGNAVQLTIDSPVTSADQHHDIIINVSNYQATLTVTKGYDGEMVRSKSYPVSTSQYAVFLRALELNGFAAGDSDPTMKDERGHCALGDRYIYEGIDANGNDLERYWYTSCGSGTFEGSVSIINQLFKEQIPDYSGLTGDVEL